MKPTLDKENDAYVDEVGTRYPFRTAAEKRLQYLLASAGCRPLRKGMAVQSKLVIRDADGKYLAELDWFSEVEFTRAISKHLNKPKETNEPDIS